MIVTLADITAFLGFTAAFVTVVVAGRKRLDRPTCFFLCLSLFIYAFVGLANALEHGGVTSALDHYEDELEILFVPTFLFFLFSLGTRRELQARQEAEAALRESEQRFRHLAEMLPEVVYEMDHEGRVTFVNRQAFELTGYSWEDFCDGLRAEQLIVPEDRPRMRDNIEALLGGGGETGLEYTMMRKDGTRFPILAYSAPLLRADGSAVGLRGILVDISRAKSLESQLAHAQKMEAVGTMAGGIAHDFNNILQGIQGYMELVLGSREFPDPRLRGYLEKAQGACERASELVRGLLTFSRRQGPRMAALDLNREVHNVVALLERLLPKMIRLETCLQDDLRPVRADPLQIEQVLMNLGTNARDAIEGSGCIEIRTENEDLDELSGKERGLPAGRYVRLSFSDSGHGMDPVAREHIFDPFFTTKEVGKGTGLGLAIVYGIVRAHGGQIVCDSTPSTGTTFTLYLPALAVAEMSSCEEVREDTGSREPTGTILVVDDEASVREIAGETLKVRGYEVVFATTGEEALDRYRENPSRFDVVVLDLGLPGMGGRRCFEEIRRLDPAARVLVASGYANGDVLGDLQGREAEGYLVKPYRQEQLIQALRKLLADSLCAEREN